MAGYTHTVAIGANREAVWELWMDIESWPKWASPIKKVEKLTPGHVKAGTRAKIHADGGPAATWEVTDVRPAEFFEWGTKVRGVQVTAGHLIQPAEQGVTVTLNLEYGGIMSHLLRPLLMRTARRNVSAEAIGLKEQLELGPLEDAS